MALSAKVDPKLPKTMFSGEMGNPLHKICYHVKGVPKSVEIEEKGEWKPHTLCEFSDSSFVNVGYLWKQYKSL